MTAPRHRAAGTHRVRRGVIAVVGLVAVCVATSGASGISGATYTDAAAAAVQVTAGPGVDFTTVSAAGSHACALDEGGAVWCWGVTDFSGAQGDPARGNTFEPVRVELPVAATAVSAGYEHTCALGVDTQVWCWGTSAYGQRGPGAGAPAVAAASGMVQVDASGAYHTCSLDTAGAAWCWGMGTSAQLGAGTTNSATPLRVAGAPGPFTSIDTGYMSTCALSGSQVWCWGNNAAGQATGTITAAPTTRPTAVGPTNAMSLSTGAWFACALDAAGAAWCWGEDQHGQHGDGTPVTSAVTAVATEARFTTLTAGDHHACALDTTGTAWCWGAGTSGQLGDGSLVDQDHPVRVVLPAGVDLVQVSAGAYFTCGIDTTGRTWCWGAAAGIGAGAPTSPASPPTRPMVPWR